MANGKRIERSAPKSIAAVQHRVASAKKDIARSPRQRDALFDALILDALTGIAEGDNDPTVRCDDPVEVAREVLRFGGELFDAEPGTWTPWDAQHIEREGK